jgi:hypothetical protein
MWIQELGKIMNEYGFDNIYEILCLIGKGSTASVHKIRRIEDGKYFSAKIIQKAYLESTE